MYKNRDLSNEQCPRIVIDNRKRCPLNIPMTASGFYVSPSGGYALLIHAEHREESMIILLLCFFYVFLSLIFTSKVYCYGFVLHTKSIAEYFKNTRKKSFAGWLVDRYNIMNEQCLFFNMRDLYLPHGTFFLPSY